MLFNHIIQPVTQASKYLLSLFPSFIHELLSHEKKITDLNVMQTRVMEPMNILSETDLSGIQFIKILSGRENQLPPNQN